MPSPTTNPTVRRRRLAAELRRLRAASGLTITEVANRLGCKFPKISRIENGHRAPSVQDVHDLARIYEIDADERERLIGLAKDSRKRGWWHTYRDLLPEWYETYVGLEAEASSIVTYESEVIPGLLQTPEYSAALTRATLLGATDEDVQRRTDLRIERQRRISGESPVELWAVISEAALRRPVGGDVVHAAQLRHLAEVSARQHVVVQVLPFSAGAHPASGMGMFTILRFPDQFDLDVVYVESQLSAVWLEELPEVERASRIMDHLRAMAADPTRSAAMIHQLEQEFERGH